MNGRTAWKDGNLCFPNFIVTKKGEHYYAVMDTYMSEEYTSGPSLNNAAKKAKLLQRGFDLAKDIYC